VEARNNLNRIGRLELIKTNRYEMVCSCGAMWVSDPKQEEMKCTECSIVHKNAMYLPDLADQNSKTKG